VQRNRSTRLLLATFSLAVLAILGATPATAQTEKILYRFDSVVNDGYFPTGTLITDKQGNLYGTGGGGGTFNQGTVFELTRSGGVWIENTLYTFTGNADGGRPSGGLVFDKSGNLYGTTFYGGANFANYGTGGVVFELSPPTTKGQPWTETVLYDFSDSLSAVGFTPAGGVSFDAAGNLYGVASDGGNGDASLCGDQGCGTLFQLQPPSVSGGSWTLYDIHDFLTGTAEDGFAPDSVIVGPGGVLYGTTLAGQKPFEGKYEFVPGIVFRLNPPTTSGGAWTERILYTFLPNQPTTGAMPNSVMLMNEHLFGTTQQGGFSNAGVIFELAPPIVLGELNETVLYNFTGGSDGSTPLGGLIMDSSGNLYGTAAHGGLVSGNCQNAGCGTVFKLSKNNGDWTETTLYDFTGGSDGWAPQGNLLMRGGMLFGTTDLGGVQVSEGAGTVFEVTP